ncbi:chromosome-associated kinesin KIF4A-like isoform X2 [Dermacentor albipictus]|uniref:chromosome-associated kinesin KIF4A-like isoform X2 n=1 Tax=Dermacentor albipictus TaxID=60249 RepID=UPI0038FC0A24
MEFSDNECQPNNAANNRELEREVAILKKERDDLSAMLSSQQNTKSAAGNKVAEQRRKRIQELEDRIGQLRKKVEEQSRMIRLKEDAERSAKKLQQEITNMKQVRVQLMKRMKEESERHRRQQTERNREVRALRVREQQQSVQMARVACQNELRINVLQRRVEEALAGKNRLEAAQRRRLENRANGQGFDSMAARVKSWLRSELLVVSEKKKLEQHLTSLIEERKAIAIETHMVEEQLKDPDMAEDKAECNARLQELKRSLQEHSDKIAEIQRKILDVEPERHIKNLASNVTDIVECRVIATSLFEMVLELSRLQDVHDELKRKTEEVETLKKALANFKNISSAKKIKRKPRATKPLFKLQAPTYEYLLSIIELEPDDVENDPDWCPSSERSQASRKRKSQEPKAMKESDLAIPEDTLT